jgi:hypothetical protein
MVKLSIKLPRKPDLQQLPDRLRSMSWPGLLQQRRFVLLLTTLLAVGSHAALLAVPVPSAKQPKAADDRTSPIQVEQIPTESSALTASATSSSTNPLLVVPPMVPPVASESDGALGDTDSSATDSSTTDSNTTDSSTADSSATDGAASVSDAVPASELASDSSAKDPSTSSLSPQSDSSPTPANSAAVATDSNPPAAQNPSTATDETASSSQPAEPQSAEPQSAEFQSNAMASEAAAKPALTAIAQPTLTLPALLQPNRQAATASSEVDPFGDFSHYPNALPNCFDLGFGDNCRVIRPVQQQSEALAMATVIQHFRTNAAAQDFNWELVTNRPLHQVVKLTKSGKTQFLNVWQGKQNITYVLSGVVFKHSPEEMMRSQRQAMQQEELLLRSLDVLSVLFDDASTEN